MINKPGSVFTKVDSCDVNDAQKPTSNGDVRATSQWTIQRSNTIHCTARNQHTFLLNMLRASPVQFNHSFIISHPVEVQTTAMNMSDCQSACITRQEALLLHRDVRHACQ